MKDRAKLERQMLQRGWTDAQVHEAIQSGERRPTVNRETGTTATRYIHPVTGRSVVIDDMSGEFIHVGADGFRY